MCVCVCVCLNRIKDFGITFFQKVPLRKTKNCHILFFFNVHIFLLRSFLVIAVRKIFVLTANFLTNRMLSNVASFEGYKFIYALLIAWMSILCNNFKNFSASITRPSSYHVEDFEIIFFAKCSSSKNEKVTIIYIFF